MVFDGILAFGSVYPVGRRVTPTGGPVFRAIEFLKVGWLELVHIELLIPGGEQFYLSSGPTGPSVHPARAAEALEEGSVSRIEA